MSMLLRSFLIQGSWNHRTMLGTGFAFAILPALREIFRGDRRGLRRAVARHAGRFNTHPFLATATLGAAARLESEGEDTDVSLRLMDAGGAALGGVGDALVWGGLLPTSSALAVAIWFAGGDAAVALIGFLVVFNAGHLSLRVRSLAAGLEGGRLLAREVADAGFAAWTGRLRNAAALATGILIGVILGRGPDRLAEEIFAGPALTPRWLFVVGIFAAVAVGTLAGRSAWRVAAAVVALGIAAASAWGMVS